MVCYAESVETVFENIREVSPEIMNGVPRVWEKIYSSVNLRMKDATRTAQVLYDWGIRAGARWAQYAQLNKPVPLHIAAERWLAKPPGAQQCSYHDWIEHRHALQLGCSSDLARTFALVLGPRREDF